MRKPVNLLHAENDTALFYRPKGAIMVKQKYDYIIVGGGSAGSVLANRLSANPKHNVLLLEAGKPDYRWDFRIHMPAALTYLLTDKTYNWLYESEPEPQMHNRRVAQPRGKVLGGSSAINGMIYIRGNALDYEKWAANEGLENWDYAHCLPYFRKFETRLQGADEYHGSNGPLYLSTAECDNPLFRAFFKSAEQAGYALTDDVNGYQQEGFGVFDQNIYRARRHNAARAYVHPVKNRSNLTVKCRAMVNRILFEGKKAVGVEYKQGKKTHHIYAGEIISSGGAINSAQLLQLSGIGNAGELKKLGIDTIQDTGRPEGFKTVVKLLPAFAEVGITGVTEGKDRKGCPIHPGSPLTHHRCMKINRVFRWIPLPPGADNHEQRLSFTEIFRFRIPHVQYTRLESGSFRDRCRLFSAGFGVSGFRSVEDSEGFRGSGSRLCDHSPGLQSCRSGSQPGEVTAQPGRLSRAQGRKQGLQGCFLLRPERSRFWHIKGSLAHKLQILWRGFADVQYREHNSPHSPVRGTFPGRNPLGI